MKIYTPFFIILIGSLLSAPVATLNGQVAELPEETAARKRLFEADYAKWISFARAETNSLMEISAFASQLDAAWLKDGRDEYVELNLGIATSFLRRFGTESGGRTLAAIYAEKVLSHLQNAELPVADRVIVQFNQPMNPQLRDLTLMKIVNRETALDGWLGVIQRVEDFGAKDNMRLPEAMFSRPPVPDGIPQLNGFPVAYPSSELREAFRESTARWQNLRRHADFRQHFAGPDGSRRAKLQAELAEFIQSNFSELPEDIAIVGRAVSQCVTDGALKEKLILEIYRGRNPFTESVAKTTTLLNRRPSVSVASRDNNNVLNRTVGKASLAIAVPTTAAVSSAPATGATSPNTPPHGLPYLPLAAVFAAGVVLWWFLTRSRPR